MHLSTRLRIPRDALVLEVGGGGSPHPRTSVLVDKFPGADGVRQRGGSPLVIGPRTLIQADGARLPFRDGQFDYAIASHVIEHVPLPDLLAFIGELQRVSARGYLEAPSIVYESMRRIPEHLWYVHFADSEVHLAPRGDIQPWTVLSDPLFEAPIFTEAGRMLSDVFFVGIEWEGALTVRVHDSLDDLMKIVPVEWTLEALRIGETRRGETPSRWSRSGRLVAPVVPRRLKQRLRTAIQARRGSLPDTVVWRDLVVCPACHGELAEEPSAGLRCQDCGHRYQVGQDDVPCLL